MNNFARSRTHDKFWSAIVISSLVLSGLRTSSISATPLEPAPFQQSIPDSTLFAELKAKAQTAGSVRVIVGLNAVYQPEGELQTDSAINAQRAGISRVQDVLLQHLAGRNINVLARFEFIPYIALTVDALALEQLQGLTEVASIEEDMAVPPTLAESVPLVGAPSAWTSGYTGNGWTVAVLDTGVDKNHPFLAAKVVSEACYSSGSTSSSLCPGGVVSTTVVGSGMPVNIPCTGSVYGENTCSHGTHVAGIAVGNGNNSGVAKGANLIAIQVFSPITDPNQCNPAPSPCLLTYTLDQIRGLERVRSLAGTHKIAAVNMSFGGGHFQNSCDSSNSALKSMIDQLRSLNIATIIAAGNGDSNGIGYTDGLSSPACISTAISVGSVGDGGLSTWIPAAGADQVSNFSNSASFLNLLAPGETIYSSAPNGYWRMMNGTSQATPHVAGAWAVLKSAYPNATVNQILSALTNTGKSVVDTRSGANNRVKPRIRIDAALDALTGQIGGVVKDVNGQAVGGAAVTFSGGGASYATTTSTSGTYVFNRVPADSGIISATKGNASGSVNVTVRPAQSQLAPDIVISQPPVADTTPPTGSFTNPQNGSTITNGSVTVSASASDNPGGSGVREVRFSAKWNNQWQGIGVDYSSPYSINWDMCAASVPDGDVELGLEVWDNANNKWAFSYARGVASLAGAKRGPAQE